MKGLKKIVIVALLLCAFSCLALSLNTVLANTDWPMFHNDLSHDGYTTSNGPMSNNLFWEAAGGGESSPTVANGIVYTGGNELRAYDALTGSLKWSFQPVDYIPGGWESGLVGPIWVNPYWSAPGIVCAPAVSGGIVYAGAEDGTMYAVDASTGISLWNYTTYGGAGYQSPYTGAITQSASVANGAVYFSACNGYVYALNAATGTLGWSYNVGGSYMSGGIYEVTTAGTPTVTTGVSVTYNGGANTATSVLYVGGAGGQVDAIDASNGNLIWTYQTNDPVSSPPCVTGGVVYIGSSDANVYALNANTGGLIWQYKTGGAVDASPAVANGVVYVGSGDGKMYALDAALGTPIWSQTVSQNPVAAIDSSAAVANDVVYFSSADSVFALNATSGNQIWTYQTGYGTDSSPAIANGILYIGSGNNNLYAFDGISAAISPTSQTMAVGQQQTFTVSASGGSGSLSYEWYVNGVNTGQSGLTYTFNAEASNIGANSIYVVATDALGVTGQSNTATVTVLSVTVTSSSNQVDWRAGQWLTYTVTTLGGTGTLHYQWYFDGAQVAGETDATYQFLASYCSVGSHTVYCTVTDSATGPVTATSNTADFTVNPQLSVTVSPSSSTTPSADTVDPGQTATFTATPAGGSGSYTYQWFVDSAAQGGATSSSTFSYSTNTPGQYSVWVEVTDGMSYADSYYSDNLNVNYPPQATISPASTTTMEVGQQQQFSITSMTGGEWPFTYEWYVNGQNTGISGYTFTYTAQASDVSSPPTITVVPTDNFGLAGQSNSITLTVYPALSASITPASWTMNVGQVQTFTVSVSGGTAPISIEWYTNTADNGPSYDTGQSGTTFDYTAQVDDAASPPSIYVVVTDGLGVQVTSNVATITVNALSNAVQTSGATDTVQGGTVTINEPSTGVSATVSTPTGTPIPDGTSIDVNSVSYETNQPAETTTPTISVSGGGSVIYYDVSVSQAGGAPLGPNVYVQVSFTDPSITGPGAIAYWDPTTSSWVQVTPTTFTAPDTLTASIPASALEGTPILVAPASDFVSPEYSLGALLALVACFAAFMTILEHRSHPLFPRKRFNA